MAKLGIIDTSVIKLSPRNELSFAWDTLSPQLKDMWDLRMAVYAAMVDRLDQNIGRVLQKLEEDGEKDNTLIIFLSDNGGCHEEIHNTGNYVRMPGETGTPESLDSYEIPWANASNTPFRMFKHWVNEGGISTPFIACYPKMIRPGTLNNYVSHIIDLMPTFIELAGGTYPSEYQGYHIKPMEGASLIPVFEGDKHPRSAPLFWEHQGNRAVRDGKWKLVSQFNNKKNEFGPWELYDMETDRPELNNLSKNYPDVVATMVSMYEKWADRVGVVPEPELRKKNKH